MKIRFTLFKDDDTYVNDITVYTIKKYKEVKKRCRELPKGFYYVEKSMDNQSPKKSSLRSRATKKYRYRG